jgi:hypothetical protein
VLVYVRGTQKPQKCVEKYFLVLAVSLHSPLKYDFYPYKLIGISLAKVNDDLFVDKFNRQPVFILFDLSATSHNVDLKKSLPRLLRWHAAWLSHHFSLLPLSLVLSMFLPPLLIP